MAINSVKKNKFGQKGFGLVEIILVAGIGIVVFLGFEQYLNLSLRSVQQDKGHIEALYLVQSMLEQSRAVRDEAWTNISGLTPGSSYYFSTAGTSPDRWITQAGTLTNGKYTMWIKTYQVERDVSKNIVSGGGVIDANTLKITASVSWSDNGGAKEVDLSEYLTNYQ